MEKSQKNLWLYPAVMALLFTGIYVFADWRRDTLESFWWYLLAALILYVVLAVGRYLIYRKKPES